MTVDPVQLYAYTMVVRVTKSVPGARGYALMTICTRIAYFDFPSIFHQLQGTHL